ncbi:hypothetical protein F0562_032544 [Nyssa sinensis]|uniref:Uncharacterized protein n=1 Tax=Nyssa sinensis TaxID=561372 RepID=A0A5J5APQ2_9ASTE|nr:hypothetical protein F0562_032544 [Nyssa sinensis]
MVILPTAYFGNIKRYWRKRKYRRLDDANKKKQKIKRLGNKKRRVWKIRLVPKLRFKVVSPLKLLAKFHDAYIDMMIGLAASNNVSLRHGRLGTSTLLGKLPSPETTLVSFSQRSITPGERTGTLLFIFDGDF